MAFMVSLGDFGVTGVDATGLLDESSVDATGLLDEGDETHSYVGRVISIRLGDYTRRIGIDGTPEAIKEAIKSAFGIRTKRAFWLEDEDNVIRCFDRDMPLGNYTLHLDEGVAIKVCHYDESEQITVHTEDKTFYTEDDFREFLNRRGWSSVR